MPPASALPADELAPVPRRLAHVGLGGAVPAGVPDEPRPRHRVRPGLALPLLCSTGIVLKLSTVTIISFYIIVDVQVVHGNAVLTLRNRQTNNGTV